jgi:geranylgeranyl diphosphate synthase, type I
LMAGQYLDLVVQATDDPDAEAIAAVLRYKSAKYTVEHPLQLGALLAGGDEPTVQGLGAFGLPLGEAFQLRDDLVDGEAASSTDAGLVEDLVRQARAALIGAPLDAGAVAALDELASLVRPS